MPKYTNPRKTWQYSRNFKVKAVKLTLQDDIQVQQVAANLGIHPFMLSRWRKEYREGLLHSDGKERVINKKDKSVKPKQQSSEIERLRKENTQLKEENDLLKKWQRYLAQEHQKDLGSSKDTES